MDSTDTQIWVIVLSGLFSGIGLVFAGYQTMQLRKEKKLTLRAWIGEHGKDLEIFRVFNEKGDSRTNEEWLKRMDVNEKKQFGVSRAELLINLKNYGELPAIVKGRDLPFFDSQPQRNVIETVDYGDAFVMMPSQEKPYIFDDKGVSLHTTKGGVAYYIFDFIYKSDESKKDKRYGFMTKVTRGGYMTIDTWNEKTYKPLT